MASILIKPITVPAQILLLDDCTPAEKLTLAMYAANPEVAEWRVCRAVGIKHDGLRLLKQRLIHKGRLVQDCHRYLISVPGLVLKKDPEGSYFVAANKGSENGQKVAPPEHRDLAPNDSLVIPAEIVELKGVGASDKFLLTLYAAKPDAPNALALRVLGISESGLKKLKNRLIQNGLLVRDGAAHRIRVPGMVFIAKAEGSYFMAEKEAVKTGKIVALASVKSVSEIYREWENLVKSMKATGVNYSTLRFITDLTLKEIELETSTDDPLREQALASLRGIDTFYFAREFLFDHTPTQYHKQGVKLLANATKEQLESFREKAEGLMLAGTTPPKLLAFFKEQSPANDKQKM
ncbi:MAG: hypothetical protein KJ070_01240 [Verrucomicrobia bacterium]|nr:hypothetical protein [Verrucomicrobiota bacterium]